MDNQVTKEDLKIFSETLMIELKALFVEQANRVELEWVKGKVARQLLNISAGSLQTLRISGKLKYRRVLGSYYYNKKDIENLFV